MSPDVKFRHALCRLSLFAVVALSLVAATARAQDEPKESPFRDFRGVSLGMLVADARAKLGTPADKSDALDLYNINDKETVQIAYDGGKVSAIVIMFMNPADALAPRAVFGTDLEAKPDGSIYKMVRYTKAGYWVSYSRTAGDSPLVTVMIQKIK
ncbi:MAG: hypothetical protein LC746_06440 [Acidobacteria bacterium]|nr:hypothetical protein [Acidobacteriota bacterium]